MTTVETRCWSGWPFYSGSVAASGPVASAPSGPPTCLDLPTFTPPPPPASSILCLLASDCCFSPLCPSVFPFLHFSCTHTKSFISFLASFLFLTTSGVVYPWFLGFIPPAASESMLRCCPVGSFHVRMSEKFIGFVLEPFSLSLSLKHCLTPQQYLSIFRASLFA
jgi:hypothetical protein